MRREEKEIEMRNNDCETRAGERPETRTTRREEKEDKRKGGEKTTRHNGYEKRGPRAKEKGLKRPKDYERRRNHKCRVTAA